MFDFVQYLTELSENSTASLVSLMFRRADRLARADLLCSRQFNRALYTAISVACGWAGTSLEIAKRAINKAGYTASVVRRLCFCLPKKEVTDGRTDCRTDRQTDGQTDGRIHPLLESWLMTKNRSNRPTEQRSNGPMDQWTNIASFRVA